MEKEISAGAGFVFVGVVGMLVEELLLQASVELTAGPFTSAIRAVAALPELSVLVGCAFFLVAVWAN
jgi:putative flippase GtrA